MEMVSHVSKPFQSQGSGDICHDETDRLRELCVSGLQRHNRGVVSGRLRERTLLLYQPRTRARQPSV